jgi:hypothetical protein
MWAACTTLNKNEDFSIIYLFIIINLYFIINLFIIINLRRQIPLKKLIAVIDNLRRGTDFKYTALMR